MEDVKNMECQAGGARRAPRDGWRKVRLGEIAILKRGKYVTRSSTREGNIPVILGGQGPAYYCDESNHDGPCVVISRSGASAGFVSYWDTPIFVTDGFLFEATEQTAIRYLFYALKANQTLLGHMQNGTGIPHVRGEDLKNFSISLPPLPIQQRIAEILGAYDDAIENNRRRIALLEKMARELYRERFVRRAEKCEEKTLLELFDFVRGKSYASDEIDVSEGVPMVNLKNIQAWGGYKSGAERLFSGEYKPEQTLNRGDVIMGVTDMTQDRRIVGHVALVPTLDHEATFSMDIIKLLPREMSNIELYSILRYSGVSKDISQLATGATVLHLRPSSLDSVRVSVPGKNAFAKVEMRLVDYYIQADNLALQNRNLARQRDRLLPRLMSGKIDLDKLVKKEVENG